MQECVNGVNTLSREVGSLRLNHLKENVMKKLGNLERRRSVCPSWAGEQPATAAPAPAGDAATPIHCRDNNQPS